jgi:hypothetical protein
LPVARWKQGVDDHRVRASPDAALQLPGAAGLTPLLAWSQVCAHTCRVLVFVCLHAGCAAL